MKSRDAALRAKQFAADDRARKVVDLERTIREFETMAADLDREIEAEEDRTGIRDTAHVSYSMLAAAAARRRENLRLSAREFSVKLEFARSERDEAFAQLALAEKMSRRGPESELQGLNPGPAAALR